MKHLLTIGKVCLALGMALMVCSSNLAFAQTEGRTATIGDPAQPLYISGWVRGNPIEIAQGKDKNVFVIEFWATWCPPCRRSIPHLSELQKKFREQGVIVVGVTQEDADTVRPFVEAMGNSMDYTVAIDDSGKTDAGYMAAYGEGGIPTAFVIDKQGRVAWVGHPMDGLDEMLDAIVTGSYDITDTLEGKTPGSTHEELYEVFLECCAQGHPSAVRSAAERVLQDHGKCKYLLNDVAWALLTFENESIRDPELGLKMVKQALAGGGEEDFAIVDTCARALFLTGDVAGAVNAQRKVVELAPEGKLKAMKRTLREYEKQQKKLERAR